MFADAVKAVRQHVAEGSAALVQQFEGQLKRVRLASVPEGPGPWQRSHPSCLPTRSCTHHLGVPGHGYPAGSLSWRLGQRAAGWHGTGPGAHAPGAAPRGGFPGGAHGPLSHKAVSPDVLGQDVCLRQAHSGGCPGFGQDLFSKFEGSFTELKAERLKASTTLCAALLLEVGRASPDTHGPGSSCAVQLPAGGDPGGRVQHRTEQAARRAARKIRGRQAGAERTAYRGDRGPCAPGPKAPLARGNAPPHAATTPRCCNQRTWPRQR